MWARVNVCLYGHTFMLCSLSVSVLAVMCPHPEICTDLHSHGLLSYDLYYMMYITLVILYYNWLMMYHLPI